MSGTVLTLGTFDHPRYEIIPTGEDFTCRCVALFLFDQDRLICERVYFDSATILRQLGIAHDPLTLRGRLATVANHPVTIGRAVVRSVLGR